MLGAIKRFVGDIRHKQALLKGKMCPHCHSRDVVAMGRPEKRKCRKCGFRWEQGGSFGRPYTGDDGAAFGP